jgi:hypothetical protein
MKISFAARKKQSDGKKKDRINRIFQNWQNRKAILPILEVNPVDPVCFGSMN